MPARAGGLPTPPRPDGRGVVDWWWWWWWGRGGLQRWSKESGNGEGSPRVWGPLSFMLQWCMFWGDVSHGHRWRSAGLDRLAPAGVAVTHARRAADGAAVVTVRYTLRPPPARRVRGGWLPAYEPGDGVRGTGTWRLPPVQSDGRRTAIPCEAVYTVRPPSPPPLPRPTSLRVPLPRPLS